MGGEARGRGGAGLIAVLLAVTWFGAAACGGVTSSVANEFCSSYGVAMHDLVVAARQYQTYPANFTSIYKSTMDRMAEIRAKAPDETLRSAFDTAAFTFSVFSGDAGLADFLTRADFSENAVIRACTEYGVTVRV